MILMVSESAFSCFEGMKLRFRSMREKQLVHRINKKIFVDRQNNPYSSLLSRLLDLKDFRREVMLPEEIDQDRALRKKIERQQCAVRRIIEDCQLRHELLEPKREALQLIHKLPAELVRDILTEWLLSSEWEVRTLHDSEWMRRDGSRFMRNRLYDLRQRRKRSDEEWKNLQADYQAQRDREAIKKQCLEELKESCAVRA